MIFCAKLSWSPVAAGLIRRHMPAVKYSRALCQNTSELILLMPSDCYYSRIPLSRAPLTRENQLVALAPWTPNFSDATLATAPMTDPVTHMCWSEQISPLTYSSQATWQAFNLSHCIEIRNTHPLSRAGQLSQTYFTHLAPILAPRNQPPTVNNYIMAGHAIVVVKDINLLFCHGNAVILTLW